MLSFINHNRFVLSLANCNLFVFKKILIDSVPIFNFMIRVKLVRVVHPVRSLPQVLDSALDAHVWNINYKYHH